MLCLEHRRVSFDNVQMSVLMNAKDKKERSTMKNILAIVNRKTGILREPGDCLSARMTETKRCVLKISRNNGNEKYSVTEYPNGTRVQTMVTKKKR